MVLKVGNKYTYPTYKQVYETFKDGSVLIERKLKGGNKVRKIMRGKQELSNVKINQCNICKDFSATTYDYVKRCGEHRFAGQTVVYKNNNIIEKYIKFRNLNKPRERGNVITDISVMIDAVTHKRKSQTKTITNGNYKTVEKILYKDSGKEVISTEFINGKQVSENVKFLADA